MSRIFNPKVARATFDAASMHGEALRHWRGADNLSADAALTPVVRHTIISRCRFEAINNAYLYGILHTLADDAIGTGPRLQIFIDDPAYVADIDKYRISLQRRENRWRKYAQKIGLARKLRLARLTKARDGEVFFQKIVNPKLKGLNRVDITLYEAEQVGSNTIKEVDYYPNGNPKEVDGIYYDRNGAVSKYRFWRVHPGCVNGVNLASESYLVNADAVIHYAHIDRPGQNRGIPEIVSSLTVCSSMRRYSEAVVAAAELGATISFVLKTDIIPEADDYELDEDEFNPETGKRIRQVRFTDVVPLAKNSGVTLPEGWDAHQLKAEQPTGTYSEFLDEKINEIGRPLSVPFNVSKGNSSDYNYASGRLDYQVYHRKITIERRLIEDIILNNLYETWETLDNLEFPEDYFIDYSISHKWMWDGFEHSDPVKEANAQKIRLENGTTTLADECAKDGKDFETVIRQRGREIALAQKFGAVTPTPSIIEKEDDEK